MPADNNFAHQAYVASRPKAPYEFLTFEPQPEVGSIEYLRRMREVGDVFERADVGAIVLVHGTFVGNDPWGLAAMLFGSNQTLYKKCCHWQKNIADHVIKDRGNFPEQYIAQLKDGLGHAKSMSINRFLWSGINNHAGRAFAAIDLYDYLSNLDLPAGKRILLCGHSHGGNVLALLTNLLAANRGGVEEFLDSVGEYASTFDVHWKNRVRCVLDGPRLVKEHPLDMVTLGMPIRYGFETTGYAKLMHFVNHRPGKLRAAYRVAGPITLGEMFAASNGDYIHELGVAGSNFLTPFSRPLWKCDRRLAEQLAGGLPWIKIPHRIAKGMRVAEEGRTLLIDYGKPGGRWWRSGMGHAEYTHFDRMLFHFELLTRSFYA